MAYEFQKLSEIEKVSDVTDDTSVYVEINGDIKRVAKNKVGGDPANLTPTLVSITKKLGGTVADDASLSDIKTAVDAIDTSNSPQEEYIKIGEFTETITYSGSSSPYNGKTIDLSDIIPSNLKNSVNNIVADVTFGGVSYPKMQVIWEDQSWTSGFNIKNDVFTFFQVEYYGSGNWGTKSTSTISGDIEISVIIYYKTIPMSESYIINNTDFYLNSFNSTTNTTNELLNIKRSSNLDSYVLSVNFDEVIIQKQEITYYPFYSGQTLQEFYKKCLNVMPFLTYQSNPVLNIFAIKSGLGIVYIDGDEIISSSSSGSSGSGSGTSTASLQAKFKTYIMPASYFKSST